jgi:hypothetical protein
MNIIYQYLHRNSWLSFIIPFTSWLLLAWVCFSRSQPVGMLDRWWGIWGQTGGSGAPQWWHCKWHEQFNNNYLKTFKSEYNAPGPSFELCYFVCQYNVYVYCSLYVYASWWIFVDQLIYKFPAIRHRMRIVKSNLLYHEVKRLHTSSALDIRRLVPKHKENGWK